MHTSCTYQLEQSPALNPFMQKLVTLAQITTRASQNYIVFIIGSTACNRDDMINMISIFPFAKLSRAIIAPAMLSFMKLLNVLSRVRTSTILLTRSTSVENGTTYRFSSFCLSISPFIFPSLKPMIIVVNSSINTVMIFMEYTICSTIFLIYLFSGFSISASSFFSSISSPIFFTLLIRAYLTIACKTISCIFIKEKMLQVGRKLFFTRAAFFQGLFRINNFGDILIMLSTISFSALYALCIQSIGRCISCSSIEKIGCSKFNLLTITATFITFWSMWEFWFRCLGTNFANSTQSILLTAVNSKVRCGKELLALIAILLRGIDGIGYTSTHGRNHLSFIAPRVVSATPGQKHGQFNLFNYSINPLHRQAYPTFVSAKGGI